MIKKLGVILFTSITLIACSNTSAETDSSESDAVYQEAAKNINLKDVDFNATSSTFSVTGSVVNDNETRQIAWPTVKFSLYDASNEIFHTEEYEILTEIVDAGEAEEFKIYLNLNDPSKVSRIDYEVLEYDHKAVTLKNINN
ncbi:hypothetical protein ACI2JA_19795 [Alkalihalobacillus sp. NPDC078783]|uniref:hypothetical protein n=1 Tax=Streptomyces albidoflavus TaxID=1886 RepID=UPI0033C9FF1D